MTKLTLSEIVFRVPHGGANINPNRTLGWDFYYKIILNKTNKFLNIQPTQNGCLEQNIMAYYKTQKKQAE